MPFLSPIQQHQSTDGVSWPRIFYPNPSSTFGVLLFTDTDTNTHTNSKQHIIPFIVWDIRVISHNAAHIYTCIRRLVTTCQHQWLPSVTIWHSITTDIQSMHKQAVREATTICPTLCKLTFDLLTSKVVSESCVTWATSVPILVFLGCSVLDLGLMYATDRRQMHIIT